MDNTKRRVATRLKTQQFETCWTLGKAGDGDNIILW